MKRLSKVLALFLVFVFVLSLAPAARAAAPEMPQETTLYARVYPETRDIVFPKTRLSWGPNGEKIDDYGALLGQYCDVNELRSSLLEQMLQCKTKLDVSSFRIPYSDANKQNLMNFILRDMPEALVSPVAGMSFSMFYVGTWTNLFFKEVTVSYLPGITSAETAQQAYASFLAAANEYLQGVAGNDAMTDVEKALILHDRLAVRCAYDYDNLLNGSVPDVSYTAYGTFLNKTAVCQGYTLAYRYLLEQIGIASRCCESDELDHVWNIVEIDGAEYHVDVTWDDPVRDLTGRVYHNNFLRSSDGIRDSGHIKNNVIDYDTTPSSTLYDSAWWSNSRTEICYADGAYWYLDGASLVRRKNNSVTAVYTVDDVWRMDAAGSYWGGCYSKLAQAGEFLLLSTPASILEFDTVSGDVRTVWSPSLSSVGSYPSIYGFTYADGVMTAAAAPGDPGPNSSAYTILTEPYLPAVTPVGTTIILEDEGNFGMRYLLREARVSAWEAASGTNAEFMVCIPSGVFTETTQESVVIGGTAYRSVRISGIPAKAIGEAVTVRSNLFSADDAYSIADACRAVIADSASGATFVAFAKALLDYGRAANAHFGGGAAPSSSYYAALGTTDPYSDLSSSSGSASGAKIVGTSLVTSDSLCLKFYVRLTGASPSSLRVRVNGQITDLALVPNGSFYTVLYPVPATEMDQLVKVEIINTAGGAVSNCYRDSVASYCAYVVSHAADHPAGQVLLCRYIERFIAASVQYFSNTAA